MSERTEISSELLIIWNKVRDHFGISKTVPLKIHWTPVYTVKTATGSAITPDYIRRSKKKISPYVNITLPDSLRWFNEHRDNVKKILVHEAIHFIIPKHTAETRKYGYTTNISKDTYTESFLDIIKF